MQREHAKGNWNEIKGRAKKAWGELTDDDFMKAEGSMDKLVGIIQQRYGDTKENIQRILEEAGARRPGGKA